jgi:dienelactone hydrolase
MVRVLFAAVIAICALPVWALETVTVAAGTPNETTALVDGPEDATDAVLVVHDYFGLSLSMQAEAKYQLGQGRRVMLIDLYDGTVAETDEEASALMNALDRTAALAKIDAAVDLLVANGHKVRIQGYSMGAGLALEAALRQPLKVASAALIYGGGYETVPDASLGTAPPILIISGAADEWSYPALTDLSARLSSLGRPAEIYVLAGEGHGYAQSLFQKGANYDQVAVTATRAVADAFLARHP